MAKRGQGTFKRGEKVEVFYRFEHDGSGDGGEGYFPVLTPDAGLFNPRLGVTDSWQEASVLHDFDPQVYSEKNRDTWICVSMQHTRWSNRKGQTLDLSDSHNTTVMVRPCDIRYPVVEQPVISFFCVRWGGPYPVPEHADDGEFGGWGDIGTCICDKYINTFFQVVYNELGPRYEVYTCFVSQSADLSKVYGPGVSGLLKGKHKAGLYYLWPVGWMDCNEGQTGYVEKESMFHLMRNMECAGIPSRHPHPSNLYHLFASKSWTASMCLSQGFNVPCTTKVNRAQILDNPRAAAKHALDALTSLQMEKYGQAEKQYTNVSGVAKLGFSWEAQDVLFFKGIDQLGMRLERLLEQAGCTADSVYVQENVPNDCEIRIYLIDGKPAKKLYSKFCEVDKGGSFSSFRRIEDRNVVLKEWFAGNDVGLADAEKQIEVLCQRWLVWLRAENSQAPAVCRMDFFVKLDGPKATVTTGELTEQGASMLGWAEGPQVTFNAVLRECMNQQDTPGRSSPPPQRRKIEQ